MPPREIDQTDDAEVRPVDRQNELRAALPEASLLRAVPAPTTMARASGQSRFLVPRGSPRSLLPRFALMTSMFAGLIAGLLVVLFVILFWLWRLADR